jgi:hypothetical protein
LIAVTAVAAWMFSAIVSMWVPGMRVGGARLALGLGWALAFGALGCAFAGWQAISAWTAETRGDAAPPRTAAISAAVWFLLASLALVGASMLAGF